MTGPRFCCCVGGLPCAHSCDFAEDYTLSDMTITVDYGSEVQDIISAGCCFNLISYQFHANCVIDAPLTLVRQPSGYGCCYTCAFGWTITGTLDFSWSFYPPSSPLEEQDTHIVFAANPAGQYDIWCSGETWIHEISVCHFQVECTTEVLTSDCEAAPIRTPMGLRCAGGVILYFSELEAFPDLSPSDKWGLTNCTSAVFGCDGASTPGLEDWNDVFLSEGGSMFFGIYSTDECSPEDPFPECDPLYGFLASGSLPIFKSAPEDSYGDWCFGLELTGEVDIPSCRDFNRLVVFTQGTWT